MQEFLKGLEHSLQPNFLYFLDGFIFFLISACSVVSKR